MNNLTIKSQEALQRAQKIAQEGEHNFIETAHLMEGVISLDKSYSELIFKKMGVDYDSFRQKNLDNLSKSPKVTGADIVLSKECQKVINKAISLAAKMKDDYVALDHLLLALLMAPSTTSTLMKNNGFNENQLQILIQDIRKGEAVNSASQEGKYDALNKYAKNLNTLSSQNKLDPVIGRDEEIRRVIQILLRRTKNNPVLVGEPGVGKTAIAEGLAHRIVNNDVPNILEDKIIYSLDMGSLLAGAKYKGEFEERLKALIKEVVKDDRIILFIDEIHTLVGAGGGEGAMDAANILKPALARGELKSIGATTLDEYQKYIEKDKALERRFQKVMIDEPDIESSISILRGIKEKYENHHKVRITDAAIIAAVNFSQRYITSRYLPDKAIDLIDEAASKLKIEINSKPEELDKMDRQIMQLEIEIAAIKRENDKLKLKELNNTLANIKEKRNKLYAKWKLEKEQMDAVQKLKLQIEDYKYQAEKAEREGDYAKVAELRYGKIKSAEETLKNEQKELEKNSENGLIKEIVTEENIAEVISKWTGIPVSKMLQSEKEKLLKLETVLRQRVVGQDEAIEVVSDAVRRSKAGIQSVDKPIGSFLFIGTTGVGKTELAKTLAQYLFDNQNAMTRIDMSEYQEKHSVSRLVGAPPGYVGFEEGGQLTEAVRRRPYQVVLLDEIEKAHSDVFNILLQLLDEGRLTDNKGRQADFKNCIVIMTSNIGSHLIQENFEKYNSIEKASEASKNDVMNLLKQSVKPEFLNRIDDIVMFNPLDKKYMNQIVKIQLDKLIKELTSQHYKLEIKPEVIDYLAEHSFDIQYGARPVKRNIQKQILNPLSKMILLDKLNSESKLLIELRNNQICFIPVKDKILEMNS